MTKSIWFDWLLFLKSSCFLEADPIEILLIDPFWVGIVLLDSALDSNVKLCF